MTSMRPTWWTASCHTCHRQWVLTLPGELARVVAFDADQIIAVFGVFADELSRWQREPANDLGVAHPQTGSLLEIPRFADGARLYPHAHALVPDGVYLGLELHAEVTIATHDRKGLERLCRYLSRPPIPQHGAGRGGAAPVSRRQVRAVAQAHPLRGSGRSARGIKAVVFEPIDLIARLAALVPAPYTALRRFHGILTGPAALDPRCVRPLVVPTPCTDDPVPGATKRPGHIPGLCPWTRAELLMRVWAAHETRALKCPHCGGRISTRGAGAQLPTLQNSDAITAILAAVHSDKGFIPATGPPIQNPQIARAAA